MTEAESNKQEQETEAAPAPEDGVQAPPAEGASSPEEGVQAPPAEGASSPEEADASEDQVASEPGTLLNSLTSAPGSRRARRRVGRGPGSGRGKTCGRGTKGQKSRSGVALNGFEGGQMPIHMRMPKRGFRNAPFRRTPVPVNLDRIQAAVDAGKLDAGAVVDIAALKKAGIVKRAPDGVRVLGRGSLTVALRIEAVGASASAAAIIEKAGGSFTRVGDSAESGGS